MTVPPQGSMRGCSHICVRSLQTSPVHMSMSAQSGSGPFWQRLATHCSTPVQNLPSSQSAAVEQVPAAAQPVEVHTYMPTSKAVATLDYASSVPGAWIVGVGFDLLPLVMLALLMLAFAEAREPYQPRKPFTVVGGREAA